MWPQLTIIHVVNSGASLQIHDIRTTCKVCRCRCRGLLGATVLTMWLIAYYVFTNSLRFVLTDYLLKCILDKNHILETNMARNITISVPDELHEAIQQAKGNIKVSAICQEALS